MEEHIKNLINTIYNAHLDNSRKQYYAETLGRRKIPLMPLTPFVFEFFLFNSLYQVDWTKSSKTLSYHPSNHRESHQQSEFVKFLIPFAEKNPSYLYRAFEPLIFLPKAQGEWTRVTPDSRITVDQGNNFFENIMELQNIIEKCKVPDEMPTTKEIFKLINDARHFIYLVRNNIFHGSKSLGETFETNQKRRIEVYDLFIKGLNSLFFLARGKSSVASDFVPCPVSIVSPVDERDREMLDQNRVWTAINRRLMKKGDSRLISQFTKQLTPPKKSPSEKSALFYPSVGIDIITPLLLGLPYCNHFYFFDEKQKKIQHLADITNILVDIPNIILQHPQENSSKKLPKYWKAESNYFYLDFVYAGLKKRINLVCADNLEFLDVDIELAFYFHRGDSCGEGGSGQLWDSELLPDLMEKVPVGKQCIILTDGEPGGISEKHFAFFKEMNFPFLKQQRKYYYGRFSYL